MTRPPSIRRDLAAYYFFIFGGMGAILPFLPLLLAGQGLSPTQVGWVMLLGPLGNLVVPPLWGWLADAFSARLALMRLTGLGCAAGALCFLVDKSFVWSLVAMAIFSAFRAPTIPLADAAAHAELEGRAHDFAHIRRWGSLGFAAFAFGVGRLDGSEAPWMMLGFAALAYTLSSVSTARLRAPPIERQGPILGPAARFVKQPSLLALLVGSAAYYIAHGSYDVYFGLHMRALGHDDAFVGLSWMVAVVAEIGLMSIAPRLLDGRSGRGFLVLCAGASVLRWGLLSSLESQVAILAAQSLHALTFGLWYLALVRYIQVRAPSAVRTTVQAVVHAVTGAGMMFGYVVSGELFEARGGQAVFQFSAGAAALAGLFYLGLWARKAGRATHDTDFAQSG